MKKTLMIGIVLCLLLGMTTGACAAETEPTPTALDTETSVMVAYFSCSGNTEAVAHMIAETTGAALYAITPEEPYTPEDLNYSDTTSRSSQEMNDASARPAISGSVEDMTQIDTIFIGYPIWWGVAPRIVSTFIESYDFAGKTIIPFCTSGGSGFGASDAALREATPDASWLEGRRFTANVADTEIVKWLDGLGLSPDSNNQ